MIPLEDPVIENNRYTQVLIKEGVKIMMSEKMKQDMKVKIIPGENLDDDDIHNKQKVNLFDTLN